MMMSRTQINLEAETLRRAQRRAAELGISLAEYVRRLVARDLGEPQRTADPSRVFSLGRSDGSDVAREKDTMVGRAVTAVRKRRRAKR